VTICVGTAALGGPSSAARQKLGAEFRTPDIPPFVILIRNAPHA